MIIRIRPGVDFDVVRAVAAADLFQIRHIDMTSSTPNISSFDLFRTFGDEETQATRLQSDCRSWIDKKLLAASRLRDL